MGLLCCEVLITVGQAAFDPSRHVADGVAVSETDAKRQKAIAVCRAMKDDVWKMKRGLGLLFLTPYEKTMPSERRTIVKLLRSLFGRAEY